MFIFLQINTACLEPVWWLIEQDSLNKLRALTLAFCYGNLIIKYFDVIKIQMRQRIDGKCTNLEIIDERKELLLSFD